MTKITVASYNMSFAGDSGLDPKRVKDGKRGVFESEGAFHKSNMTGNPRQYWINALQFVIHFWNNEADAAAMGLQEMNCTVGVDTGSAAVDSAMKAINPDIETETKQCQGGAKPCMTIVWKKSVLGEKDKSEIYDLDYEPIERIANGKPAHGKQAGRPIQFLLTNKKILLVNIHAPNSPNVYTFQDFKIAFQAKLATFLGDEEVDPKNIIVMGDFNDRYDALNEIPVGDATLTYQGKAPLSCCHNWDSSCSANRYSVLDTVKQTGTCVVPEYTAEDMNPAGDDYVAGDEALIGKKYALAGPGKRILMKEEGELTNYRYYGDKIFAANPVTPITTYRPLAALSSTQSDHEMVKATIEIGMAGGKRSKGRRSTRKSKAKKSKASRKH
jgi:hypothetical protein